MTFQAIILLATATFTISAVFTHRFCDPDSVVYVLDHPTDRSLHDRPVPRGGGLAILIAIFICGSAVALFGSACDLAYVASAMIIVAGISFLDDRYSVSPFYRLIAHGLAAAVIIYGGFSLRSLGWTDIGWRWSFATGATFSMLFTVWMINLYNFMDGMDGFAGGMAVIGFGVFALLGWQSGNVLFMLLSLITAAAAGGFLIFNFPPARIFMGDVGSSTLGLLAGTFSLWGTRDGIFPFWIALLVFSPFIVDATVTLLRRLFRGEKVWQAHKTHYYQRLVQAGWGHRKTVLWEYALMSACALSAIWAVRRAETIQWWTMGFWALAYILLIAMVRRREAENRRNPKSA